MNTNNASEDGVSLADRFPHRVFHLQGQLDKAQKNLIRIYLRQAMVRGEMPMRKFLQHLEKRLIVLALILCSGRLHTASEMLNVKKTTLYEKIKKYRICKGTEFLPVDPLAEGHVFDFVCDREDSDD